MKIKNLILATATTLGFGIISNVHTTTVSADTTVPVYRLYNHNTGEHFYTKNQSEKVQLSTHGWNDEGIGWYSGTSGSPVYRVYNPNSVGGDHYYTMSRYEAQSLVSKGWRWDDKGKPVFYSAGNQNLYVAYNPNASSGSHNYTTNTFEQNSLLSRGWTYGKVAWKTYGNKPLPTTKYLGWVSVDGVIKYSKTFDTAGEAQQYALSMYRQEGASNWESDNISWGVRPVQE
ncbi:glycoside hydrolase, family 25 [Lactococcus lactis]|uniref:glycoside hydrolase, family 25 n=1 Tax=Lactococcus lactis TaxID=1358 RepID=UPI001EEFFD9E|nr:glycoside hydrolase, family 25 [Lactococcus lactis]